MNGGVVTGGWGFVWAAYAVTLITLAIYAVSLFARLRDAKRNDHD